MKRTLSLLLGAIIAMVANAYDIVVDGIYYNVDGTEASVSNGGYNNNYSGDIVIPSSVEYDGITYTVTSIDRDAFDACGQLTSVVIPESVTAIEDSAFLNCQNLKSVTIPASIGYVGESAFDGTAWYQSMPDGIVYIGSSLYEIGRPVAADILRYCGRYEIYLPIRIISLRKSDISYNKIDSYTHR